MSTLELVTLALVIFFGMSFAFAMLLGKMIEFGSEDEAEDDEGES